MSSEGLKHKFFTLKAKMMIKKQYALVAKKKLTKPMNEWKVAILTTAGVHLREQKPFDVEAGDHTVHFIPSQSLQEDLTVTHTHYDTSDATEDINCIFPLSIIHELSSDGVIGEVANTHYGMMGYIPRTELLQEESIPLIIEQLKKEKVDILLASPG